MEATPEEQKILIIEELYFITPFDELTQRFNWDKSYEILFIQMLRNSEISQFTTAENDFIKNQNVDIENLARYWYLATKKGLLMQYGIP